MYSIRWSASPNGMHTLVGPLQTILSCACIFESLKKQYKIASVDGFIVSQSDVGVGGYLYWLEKEEIFDD